MGKEASGIRVFGLVAALAEQGPRRGPQNIFVNRRIVKDKTIAHAIIEAYSVASVKERSPEVHLFIEMEPDQVDVNVHPTKAEVRFRNQSAVHEVVRRALGAALGQGPAPELQLRGEAIAVGAAGGDVVPGPARRHLPESMGAGPGPGTAPVPCRAGPRAASSQAHAGGRRRGRRRPSPADAGAAPLDGPVGALGVRPMIPLGQFRDTFIIAIDDEGIAIIDQHVAHERVLFERVMQRLTDGRLESQLLLEPLVVELSAERVRGDAAAGRRARAVRVRRRGVRRQQRPGRRRARAADAGRERGGRARAGRGPRRPRPRGDGRGGAEADRRARPRATPPSRPTRR